MDFQKWIENRMLQNELIIGKLGVEDFQKNGKTWIKIPYVLRGEVVNNKYRCLDDKAFYQDSDGVKCFYNQDVIFDETLKNEQLIICEGEADAWAAIQSGFVRVVSVPDGAPSEEVDYDSKKYSYLFDVLPVLRSMCPYVVLAVDGDKAGANLLNDLSRRIGRDFCKWVKYPKGCKDLNDALIKYGQAGVVKSIQTQEWMDVDGVFKISELPPVSEAKIYNTGFTGFESAFKLRLGDFSVVTGIPSMGKSTFVNDLMARIVQKHRLNVSFASLEQHPTLDHVRNLKRWYKGCYPDSSDYQAEQWIEKYFTFIYPSEEQQLNDTVDLGWFLEKASTAVIRNNAQVIVLDPWNELEHTTERNESLTEYVGSSIRRLKRFAKLNNVHVMVVAHPAKMLREKDGSFPMPSLYNISDSAHWANKADIGLVVHRENFESTTTQIACVKSRYHDIIGKPQLVDFTFNSFLNKYECVEM